MARQRVKLAFIVNDAARKETYKKRSKNVLKKVNELSTLCGIEACAIVYGPYEPEPEIWPPSPSDVQKVVSKFRAKPEFEQSKKKLSQEDYLKQSVVKAEDQLMRLRKENRQTEMQLFMYEYFKRGQIDLNNISLNDLNDLSWFIDHNLKDIGRRLEVGYTDNGQGQIMTAPSQLQLQMTPPPPPAATTSTNAEMAMTMNHGHVGMINDDIMQMGSFMDLLNGNGDETIPSGQRHDANL
jgi:hypothetical protein